VPHKRLIARLDIKGENVVKGFQMDGLRVVGSASEMARRYYEENIDEIFMIDVVASLFGREAMAKIIRQVTEECFVPMTVGGGIRSLEDADLLFRAGADKVAVNTAAVEDGTLLRRISGKYGSQATVLQLDSKTNAPGEWEVYTEMGRTPTGLGVAGWVERAVELGVGEILVTSVDRDGTRSGLDLGLLNLVASSVEVPVIGSGGVGSISDSVDGFRVRGVSGLAIGSMFHYGVAGPQQTREESIKEGIDLRVSGIT
jgi:cyclase